MTRFTYLFLLLFISVMLEMFCDFFGMTAFFAAPVIFYTAYIYGFGWGAGAAVLTGCIMDFASGMDHPLTAAAFLLIAGLGYVWLHHLDSGSPLLLMAAGFLCVIPQSVFVPLIRQGCSLNVFAEGLSFALVLGIVEAVLMPVLVILLDMIGGTLKLRTFSESRERFRKEQKHVNA